MVQDQGIDVYLAPFSDITKRYPEYTAPAGSPARTNDLNEVYIEAVDGERFVIVVDLLEEFDTHQSKMLRIAFNIDDEGTNHHRTHRQLQHNVPAGANLKGRHICDSDARKINGRWVECGFLFAALKMDEELEMDSDEVARKIETHGKITVTIQRGERVKTNLKKWQRRFWNGYQAADTQVSSKAVVKDKHVSHAIRQVSIGRRESQLLTRSQTRRITGFHGLRWKNLPGTGGDRIRFTIRYRSRDALQKLKIIPKDKACIDLTMSPPPSPRVKREEEFDASGGDTEQDQQGMLPVKREPGLDAPVETHEARPPANAAETPLADAHTLAHQHEKKRKAMEDELKEVELEQKRLRLVRGLAELDAGQ